MSLNLTRESDLADQLGWSEAKTAEKRRREKWPHINFGRFDKRYTDAQIEQIIAMHAVTPGKPKTGPAIVIEGQTERSKRRSA